MTIETILNPQIISAMSLSALAVYAIFSITTDKAVEQNNEDSLNIHQATLMEAQKLYKAVESEMSKKIINSELITKNEMILKLNSQLEELEKRKQDLLIEITKMEQGDFAKLIQEIELIRNEIGDVYNSLERELNPVMKLIEEGKTLKATHELESIKHKHSSTIKKTDESMKVLKKKQMII